MKVDNSMKMHQLEIEGLWLVDLERREDSRGAFYEWFKHSEVIESTGIDFGILQANISISRKGTIRGIHYSLVPGGQAKWVTCLSGSIRDIVVDIRPDSLTFGKCLSIDLEGDDQKAIFVGPGLGHGFASLANESTIAYLLSSPYSPKDELEINPLDLQLRIDWGVNQGESIISDKDKHAPTLQERFVQKKLPR